MKMKKVLAIGLVVLLLASVLSLVMAPVMAVRAMAAAPPGVNLQAAFPPADQVLSAILVIAAGFASLLGVSSLIAAVVNLLKWTGLVQDGTSDRWVAGLNLLCFIGLVAFGVFRPDLSLQILDGFAGQIAFVVMFVLGFLVSMTGSRPMYEGLKAAHVPVIGKSFSA